MMRLLRLILPVILIVFGVDSYVQSQDIILPDDSVWGLSWSPDSTRIAVGRFDGNVEIWDVASGRFVLILETGDTSQIVPVAWSPDGMMIAAANENQQMFIWNANTGMLVQELNGEHTDTVASLAWNPSSTHLAGLSLDYTLQIWDVTLQTSIVQRPSGITGLDWYNDRIAVGISRGLGIYDSLGGDFLYGVGQHDSQLVSVAWSPDGEWIASGGADGSIYLWDMMLTYSNYIGIPTSELHGHNSSVFSLDWHPDGRYIASAGLDGTVRIWDTTTGEQIHGIDTGAFVLCVQWSPDGTRLAYAGDVEAMGAVLEIVDVADLMLPDVED